MSKYPFSHIRSLVILICIATLAITSFFLHDFITLAKQITNKKKQLENKENTTTQKSINMSKVKISIVSDTELAYTEGEQSESRYVDLETVSEEYWSWAFLLEIAAYMSISEFLANRYPAHVNHLQWVLYHTSEDPSRTRLVHSMRYLMSIWSADCTASDKCIARPSKAMLGDRELLKLLQRYGQLQTALKDSGGNIPAPLPLNDFTKYEQLKF